jgi:allantoin racemase
MQVRIRVISPIVSKGFRSAQALRKPHWQGIELSLVQIEAGPLSIESRYEEVFAAPQTVMAILQAEKQGMDAVVIDCFGDPGLGAARERVTIPVVGAGQCAIHLASMLGGRFGVLTPLEHTVPWLHEIVHESDQSRRFVGCRATNVPVLELEGTSSELQAALLRLALDLVRLDGADTLVLGCTAMNDAAEKLAMSLAEAGHPVPVIDPIHAAIHFARALVDSRLSQSKLCYPTPSERAMPGYPIP